MNMPSHTISVLVRNKPGVLVRVALVFARRGYNIDSLVVSPVLDSEFSRMTITCSGDPATLDQIIKQLFKLIDVVRAIDHTGESVIEKEMALIKVKCPPENRTGLLQIAEHFKGTTVDFGHESLILQMAGGSDKIDHVLGLLQPFGIVDLVRTGKILMARGADKT
ncbi:MAG: acetolactate synthase small subunit [Fibrobacteres bacterium]|nr:acetolactate synthase small subunit [Fibrobacterota bacterium]MBK9575647.1 acetolactate synthase small subunit [Fibrobacterota bacterium]